MTLPMSAPLVMPNDVLIIPLAEVSIDVRNHLDVEEGDYVVTRPHARTPSRVLNTLTAKLLHEFRDPTTIVDAVIRYSKTHRTDPEETLEAAYPVLQRLLQARMLVMADDAQADGIVQSFQRGDELGPFSVLRCIQLLDDTELYQARAVDGRIVALKMVRPGGHPALTELLAREAHVLRCLNGRIAPRLIGHDVGDLWAYLATEWCAGVHASEVADELRKLGADGAQQLVALCCRILDAYAELHTIGVIHADVHPRNVLVDKDEAVHIIDFGLARLRSGDHIVPQSYRGGVGFYFEPEYARACLTDEVLPEASEAGEQYAGAVLCYYLLTGAHYLEFSLERNEMLRQIVEDVPCSFASRGTHGWPEVEGVLRTALAKEPTRRYASLSDFAQALRAAGLRDGQRHGATNARPTPAPAQRVLEAVLKTSATNGPLYVSGLPAPTCSINYGAAGIAYSLYRIAGIQNDGFVLAQADAWCAKAVASLSDEDAFQSTDLDITPATVGSLSPYHSPSGVFAVQALIAHALGIELVRDAAIDAFVQALDVPCDCLDLTLGRSGALLACSLLHAIGPAHEKLHTAGDTLLRGLEVELDGFPAIDQGRELVYLGIAHGWAGMLYAILRWYQTTGRSSPKPILERLHQLGALAEPIGRGLRWPLVIDPDPQRMSDGMSGWCHGSAGYVHLWTLAYTLLGDPTYLALAEGAAWHAWEAPDTVGSLCCGLAGRAYALLNVYKTTGQSTWLDRARRLADAAPAGIATFDLPVNSLYKGEPGIAILAADLSYPEGAAMPFFESEGWHVS